MVLFVLLLTLLLGLLILRILKDRSVPADQTLATDSPAAADEIPTVPSQAEQPSSTETDVTQQSGTPQLSDVPIEYPDENTAAEPYSPSEEPATGQGEVSEPFAEYSPRGSNETPDVPLT